MMVELIKEHPIGLLFLLIAIIVVVGWWISIFWGGYHLVKDDLKGHKERRLFIIKEKNKNKRITEFSVWWTEAKENRYHELLAEEKAKQEERNKKIMEAIFDKTKKSSSVRNNQTIEFQFLQSDRNRHIQWLQDENNRN